MRAQIFIGIIAGLLSVLLFGALITGSPIAFFLFYLASLPLFVAGFGWSWPVAGIGAVIGAAALAVLGGAQSGLIYSAAIAGPAVWLSFLATQSRSIAPAAPATPPAASQDADTGAPDTVQWYPVGRLVLWCSLIGGMLILPSMIALGFTYDQYHEALRQYALRMLEAFQSQGELPKGDGLDAAAGSIARLAPAATACAWMTATLVNMYLAAQIVRAAGRLPRPWPALALIDFPPRFSLAMLAALAGSFLPGMAGLVAGVFAAVFTIAYATLGMAVMHAATLGSPVRILILAAVYIALAFMGWPVVILAALGLGEPLFKLRARALARHAPPAPPPGGPPPHV